MTQHEKKKWFNKHWIEIVIQSITHSLRKRFWNQTYVRFRFGSGATYFVQFIVRSQRILSGQHGGREHDATEDDIAEIAVIAEPMAKDAKSVNKLNSI